MRKKISLIGAGNVGGTLALYIAQKGLGDIVLLDTRDGIPHGKALDLLHSLPLWRSDITISPATDYALTENSDIYVISAGYARQPGMSRDDLLKANAEVIRGVGTQIKRHSPQALIIMVTNPLDAMTQYMQAITGFPPHRVMGMAGVLDGARFKALVSETLNISVKEIDALVMGGHGADMVPLPRYCTISGIPLSSLLSSEKIQEIITRVRRAGGEIVNYLKTGSAFYSPAAGVLLMLEAIIHDTKRLLTCSAYLKGEYGIDGYYMGVPVIVGGGGVEKIVELDLTAEEKRAFSKSFKSCRANIDQLKSLQFL